MQLQEDNLIPDQTQLVDSEKRSQNIAVKS